MRKYQISVVKREMRRINACLLIILLAAFSVCQAAAEEVSGIRDLFQIPVSTATPAPNAFRFRDGIRWGMNRQQVKALETATMTEKLMPKWSVMITDSEVTVSRFTAHLVFIFYEDQLLMIMYEFQNGSAEEYQYLTGALSAVYGDKHEAEPLKIKALMDAINPNKYVAEQIRQPSGWSTEDGTLVYQYYYSQNGFAITYVSPELDSRIYQTNGL